MAWGASGFVAESFRRAPRRSLGAAYASAHTSVTGACGVEWIASLLVPPSYIRLREPPMVITRDLVLGSGKPLPLAFSTGTFWADFEEAPETIPRPGTEFIIVTTTGAARQNFTCIFFFFTFFLIFCDDDAGSGRVFYLEIIGGRKKNIVLRGTR